MKDEFVNRLGMFQTALGTLNSTEHKPTWFNQPPLAFTTKVAQAVTAVADLEAFLAQHGADITGAAADKRREEQELEVAAYQLGSALAVWFRDQNEETNAAKVDRPLSGWRRLRGQTLLEATRLTRDLAQAVVSGPQSAAAAAYGVTAAAVTALSGEIDDYAVVITAPQQSLAQRKALTQQFRARFNAVEAIFDSLDLLILQLLPRRPAAP